MQQTTTQFKTLVQQELSRLQSIIADNGSSGMYPISRQQYANTVRSSTLLRRQPSKHSGLFSLALKLRVISL